MLSKPTPARTIPTTPARLSAASVVGSKNISYQVIKTVAGRFPTTRTRSVGVVGWPIRESSASTSTPGSTSRSHYFLVDQAAPFLVMSIEQEVTAPDSLFNDSLSSSHSLLHKIE